MSGTIAGKRQMTAIEWQRKMLETMDLDEISQKLQLQPSKHSKTPSKERSPKEKKPRETSMVLAALIGLASLVPIVFACSLVAAFIAGTENPIEYASTSLVLVLKTLLSLCIIFFAQAYIALEIIYHYFYDLLRLLVSNPDFQKLTASIVIPKAYSHYAFAIAAITLMLLSFSCLRLMLRSLSKPVSFLVLLSLLLALAYFNMETFESKNTQLVKIMSTEYKLEVPKFVF